MAKYIEKKALEVALNHRLNFLIAENGEYDHYTSGFDEAVTRVENFPAADVVPVRHGRWIMGTGENGLQRGYRECSRCGEIVKYGYSLYGVHNFCNYCGAMMDDE